MTAFLYRCGRLQEFFAQKGFTNEPGRCPECRTARKAERGAGGYASRGGYGGQRKMFPAVCTQCGKDTQVPFQPRTDRPVYCSECFSAQRPDNGHGHRSGGTRGRNW